MKWCGCTGKNTLHGSLQNLGSNNNVEASAAGDSYAGAKVMERKKAPHENARAAARRQGSVRSWVSTPALPGSGGTIPHRTQLMLWGRLLSLSSLLPVRRIWSAKQSRRQKAASRPGSS